MQMNIERVGFTLWIKEQGSPEYIVIDTLPGVAVVVMVVYAALKRMGA